MKRLITVILALCAFSSMAEEVPKEIHTIIPVLQTWGTDPVLIEAVKKQNAKNLSLDAIKARDASWRKTEGLDAEM